MGEAMSFFEWVLVAIVVFVVVGIACEAGQ